MYVYRQDGRAANTDPKPQENTMSDIRIYCTRHHLSMYTCTYAVCVTNLTVSKGVNCVLHRKLLFCCMYDDRTILPELFGVTELLFPVSQLCLHDALSGRLSWQSYRDSRSISAHPSTLLILYSTGGRQWCPAPRPPPPSSRGHWLTAAQLWVPHAGFASLRFHRAGE